MLAHICLGYFNIYHVTSNLNKALFDIVSVF